MNYNNIPRDYIVRVPIKDIHTLDKNINPDQPLSMRTWQMEAFPQAIKHDLFKLIAFGGSGKSLFMVWVQIHDIITSNYNRKQLVLVPQSHISYGFTNSGKTDEIVLQYQDKTISWRVHTNCCDNSNNRVVKELKEFLLADPTTMAHKDRPGALACIATHAGFVSLWKNYLNDNEKKLVLNNLSIYVDECHHLTAQLNKEEVIQILENRDYTQLGDTMGKIIDMKQEITSFKLRIMTATFHRGDGKMILSKQHLKNFGSYHLTWEEYYPTLGIKEFHFNFIMYKNNPLSLIKENIANEKKERHIIIIPPKGTKFRTNKTLPNLRRYLEEIYPKERIIDLVTTNTQFINKEQLNSCPTNYNVAIACNLFNEGTDWPPSSRMHNCNIGSSLQKQTQINFRIQRKFEGKSCVKVYNYIKEISGVDPSKIRAVLNDRLNALLLILLEIDLFAPIKVPALPQAKKKHILGMKDSISLETLLGEAHPVFKEELIKQFEYLEDKRDLQQIEQLITNLCEDFYEDYAKGIVSKQDFHEATKVALIRAIRFSTGKTHNEIKKINISFIRKNGFNKIWEKEKFIGSIVYGTQDPLTLGEFKTFRQMLDKRKELYAVKNTNTLFNSLSYQDKIENQTIPQTQKEDFGGKIGKWLLFEIPVGQSINNKNHTIRANDNKLIKHARLKKADIGDMIEAFVYKGEIKINNDKILYENEYIYSGSYWRHKSLPESMTPNVKAIANRFIFDKDIAGVFLIPKNWVLYIVH